MLRLFEIEFGFLPGSIFVGGIANLFLNIAESLSENVFPC